MSGIEYPEDSDLLRLIRFSQQDGTIWLAENRMVLLHAAALASLRKELIASIGPAQTRRILTRMGYAAGLRDAELAKQVRGNCSDVDAFVAGPQLHMLEGTVVVKPVRLEMDVAKGQLDGEFLWLNSVEADAHLKEFGPAQEPVCWMQIGYASGYTSGFMGRFILFKEVECSATGKSDHCRIVGKPVEQWPDAHEHTPYYEADSIVGRMLELRDQVDALRSTIEAQNTVSNLLGNSPGFRHAFSLVSRAAGTHVTVLLLGETGVGKERFARALHQLSNRSERAFVAVNCAALPHDLVESELFGVERGAYTGASVSRMGKFERADGGTLFLDEIGELPLAAQAKLLRVLQEGELERLGDERVRKVDVRLVAATNADLQTAVREGRFRADLYYRLNVYPVLIPPLRERLCDIPQLVEAMLERFCAMHGKRLLGVTDRAMQELRRYDWPGNVRELENLIERGVILASQHGRIEAEQLFVGRLPSENAGEGIGAEGNLGSPLEPPDDSLCEQVLSAGLSLDEVEEMLIRFAVRQADGNLAGAARTLGMTRAQLSYRLKKHLADDNQRDRA